MSEEESNTLINEADILIIKKILDFYEKQETLYNTSYCLAVRETKEGCLNCLTKHSCETLIIGKSLFFTLELLIKNNKVLGEDSVLMKHSVLSSIIKLMKIQ